MTVNIAGEPMTFTHIIAGTLGTGLVLSVTVAFLVDPIKGLRVAHCIAPAWRWVGRALQEQP